MKAFARGGDPIAMIREASQALVLRTLETGWEGPPYNPLYIAQMLNVRKRPVVTLPGCNSTASARLAC